MKSNFSSPKGTIFKDGEPVKELIGVYTLDVLECMANNLDLDDKARDLAYSLTGRGFKARAMSKAILDYLSSLPEVVVEEG